MKGDTAGKLHEDIVVLRSMHCSSQPRLFYFEVSNESQRQETEPVKMWHGNYICPMKPGTRPSS